MIDPDRDDLARREAQLGELLGVVADRLSSHWTASAHESLELGEPNEALLQIAWGIAEERLTLDESSARRQVRSPATRL